MIKNPRFKKRKLQKMGDYPKPGDMVKVTSVEGFNGSCRKKHFFGKKGMVLSNDGLGFCRVEFENLTTRYFWSSQLEVLED